MVEPALYAAFGACLATLILLLFLPAFWRRAVRLTTRRLANKLPLSVAEIVAAQDRLRAEHAMTMRATERRAETALAEAARERAETGKTRSDELALKAELANLRDTILTLEARGALVRVDLDRSGAEAAATAKALETADAEGKTAVRERDAALKQTAAVELAANGLRIDLAATEAALASARADLVDTRKRLTRASSALTAKDKRLAAETSRADDADDARLAAERRLVDETAKLIAVRADIARTTREPATKSVSTPDPALAALRARLDEVADDIVRAAGASDGGRMKEAGPAPQLSTEHAARLLQSHA